MHTRARARASEKAAITAHNAAVPLLSLPPEIIADIVAEQPLQSLWVLRSTCGTLRAAATERLRTTRVMWISEGIESSRFLRPCDQVYEMSLINGDWVKLGRLPVPRRRVGCCLMTDGRIALVGGDDLLHDVTHRTSDAMSVTVSGPCTSTHCRCCAPNASASLLPTPQRGSLLPAASGNFTTAATTRARTRHRAVAATESTTRAGFSGLANLPGRGARTSRLGPGKAWPPARCLMGGLSSLAVLLRWAGHLRRAIPQPSSFLPVSAGGRCAKCQAGHASRGPACFPATQFACLSGVLSTTLPTRSMSTCCFRTASPRTSGRAFRACRSTQPPHLLARKRGMSAGASPWWSRNRCSSDAAS